MTKATRLKTTIAKKNQIINGVTQEKDKEREKLPPKDTITQIFSDLGDKFINGGFKLDNEDFVTQWENHVDWHVVQSHGPRGNKHTKTNNKWMEMIVYKHKKGSKYPNHSNRAHAGTRVVSIK